MFFAFWRGRPTLARFLFGCAVGAMLWIGIFEAQGYRVGNRPAIPLPGRVCYQHARVDFVIPMYRRASC